MKLSIKTVEYLLSTIELLDRWSIERENISA
jgi:hypothetical protein